MLEVTALQEESMFGLEFETFSLRPRASAGDSCKPTRFTVPKSVSHLFKWEFVEDIQLSLVFGCADLLAWCIRLPPAGSAASGKLMDGGKYLSSCIAMHMESAEQLLTMLERDEISL